MSKKKLYFGLLFFFVTASLPITQNVQAHPPESIYLEYQPTAEILTVLVYHPVTNPYYHYISSVEVQLNGNTEITETYTSQGSTSFGGYSYEIAAENSDRITVIATCNQGGSMTNCIMGDGGEDPRGCEYDYEIPGYFGLLAILGISVVVLLTVTHRKFRENL